MEEASRELINKVADKLVPAIAFVATGPTGAIVANVIISSILLFQYRSTKARSLEEIEAKDLERLVELSSLIDAKREEIERIRKQISKEEGTRRRILEDTLRTEVSILQGLEEEYELTQLRILAIRRLLSLNDEKVKKEIEKIIRDIQEGKLSTRQYEVIKMVQDAWNRRQLEISTLRGMLERM